MIDPITQHILEREQQEDFSILLHRLNEAPNYKAMGITRLLADPDSTKSLSHINMKTLMRYIENEVKKATDAGAANYSKGLAAGASSGIRTGLAAAAIAALVITVAYKTYKRFLSKGAKACKKYSGDKKTSCMYRYKRYATNKRVEDLNQGKEACKHTKDPSKCVAKIDKKITKLKATIGEV